jgi:ferritin-like metal-binding protein YciE
MASDRTLDEQLTKHLTDLHSIEVQALAQMKAAPKLASDPQFAEIFAEHERQTDAQEKLVADRLRARGAEPSTVKDIAGRVGGWGMVLFARVNPDTPGKLAAHAYSYEHMELAAYELVRRVALRAGDAQTADMAARIGEEEREMGVRIAANFDRAVSASLREKGADDVREEVVKYLRDAHALEAQALQLLSDGARLVGYEPLAQVFREHHAETEEQQRLVDARLDALGSGPSRVQAAALRVGGLNLGGFFKAQPDTPAKLAGFAYAFEHLEIAGYELLARVAKRAGDGETEALAEGIMATERQAAERVAATWDGAVDASLAAVGATS